MKFTRKQFLSTVATGLVGTALRPRLLEAAVSEKTAAAKFAKQVGTSFTLQVPRRGAVELVLDRLDTPKASKGTTQFSLQFMAPAGDAFAEGTYDVEHATLGKFQVFLTPLPADAQSRTWYRADFNLLDGSVPLGVNKL